MKKKKFGRREIMHDPLIKLQIMFRVLIAIRGNYFKSNNYIVCRPSGYVCGDNHIVKPFILDNDRGIFASCYNCSVRICD